MTTKQEVAKTEVKVVRVLEELRKFNKENQPKPKPEPKPKPK